jgi:hypothetical protein
LEGQHERAAGGNLGGSFLVCVATKGAYWCARAMRRAAFCARFLRFRASRAGVMGFFLVPGGADIRPDAIRSTG